jgi:hypothetical protein
MGCFMTEAAEIDGSVGKGTPVSLATADASPRLYYYNYEDSIVMLMCQYRMDIFADSYSCYQ